MKDRPTEIEILSEQTNAAVVRMPGRRFPGVVIQGDDLNSLHVFATMVVRDLKDAGAPEQVRGIAEMLDERLRAYLIHYEQVLAKHGFSLPYSGSVRKTT